MGVDEKENVILGLPSIDMSTPSSELCKMLIKIDESSDRSQKGEWWKYFDDYNRADLMIKSGTVSLDSLKSLEVKIVAHPKPEEVIDILRFWDGLAQENSLLDEHAIRSRWIEGIEQLEDPIRKGLELALFTRQTGSRENPKLKNELIEVTEDVKETLPSYTYLREYFSGNERPKVEEKEIPDFNDLRSYIVLFKKVGLRKEVQEIDNYLLNILTELNLEEMDGHLIRTLLNHTTNSDLEINIKRTRLQMVLQASDKMPKGVGKRDSVLKGLVESCLRLDDWDEAIEVWDQMNNYSTINHAVGDFAYYSLKNNLPKSGRISFADFKRNLQRHDHYVGDGKDYEHDWDLQWLLSAWKLSFEGINAMNDRVVTRAISKGTGDFMIDDLTEILNRFPEDELYKQLILSRLGFLIKKFNKGDLNEQPKRELLKALIELKGTFD